MQSMPAMQGRQKQATSGCQLVRVFGIEIVTTGKSTENYKTRLLSFWRVKVCQHWSLEAYSARYLVIHQSSRRNIQYFNVHHSHQQQDLPVPANYTSIMRQIMIHHLHYKPLQSNDSHPHPQHERIQCESFSSY